MQLDASIAPDAKNAAFEAAKLHKAGRIDDDTFTEMIKTQVGKSKLVEMMKATTPVAPAPSEIYAGSSSARTGVAIIQAMIKAVISLISVFKRLLPYFSARILLQSPRSAIIKNTSGLALTGFKPFHRGY